MSEAGDRLQSVRESLLALEAQYCPIVGVGFALAAIKAGQQAGTDPALAAREARRCLRAVSRNNDALPAPAVRRQLVDAQQALLGIEEVSV